MNIFDKFKDELCDATLHCTQEELNEYLTYGVVFNTDNKYYDRSFNELTIELVKPKGYDYNFQDIIQSSCKLAKSNYVNRIYCMTASLFKKYNDMGLIITKDNNNYFRKFDKEEWLVNIYE